MDIKRIIQHSLFTDWQTHRAFSQECLHAIERAIHESEKLHDGEIRFAIEGSLDGLRLIKVNHRVNAPLKSFPNCGSGIPSATTAS